MWKIPMLCLQCKSLCYLSLFVHSDENFYFLAGIYYIWSWFTHPWNFLFKRYNNLVVFLNTSNKNSTFIENRKRTSNDRFLHPLATYYFFHLCLGSAKSSSGLLEMPRVQSAAEAVVLVNHVTINPEGKRLNFIVFWYFFFWKEMHWHINIDWERLELQFNSPLYVGFVFEFSFRNIFFYSLSLFNITSSYFTMQITSYFHQFSFKFAFNLNFSFYLEMVFVIVNFCMVTLNRSCISIMCNINVKEYCLNSTMSKQTSV